MKKTKWKKKRLYNERILQIEHGSFTLLLFATIGGMRREASTFFSKPAERIAEKIDIKRSEVMF